MAEFERVAKLMNPPFMNLLGIEAVSIAAGQVVTRVLVRDELRQQDGFVHAGVAATMADHSAGGAAATLMRADQTPLTVEFKLNLLRPAVGRALVCESVVLKAGKTLSVAESAVFAEDDQGDRKLIAKAIVTLAVVALP